MSPGSSRSDSRTPGTSTSTRTTAGPVLLFGLPHVPPIESCKWPSISYQDTHMLLLTIAGGRTPPLPYPTRGRASIPHAQGSSGRVTAVCAARPCEGPTPSRAGRAPDLAPRPEYRCHWQAELGRDNRTGRIRSAFFPDSSDGVSHAPLPRTCDLCQHPCRPPRHRQLEPVPAFLSCLTA